MGHLRPSIAPRPFGPLFAIAEVNGAALGRPRQGESPQRVALALAGELASSPPALLVLGGPPLGRRSDPRRLHPARAPGRNSPGPGGWHIPRRRPRERPPPLRKVLGELATTAAVRRLKLAPLPPDAVGQLAVPHAVDGQELYDKTGGNPFFVEEVLAGGGDEIPPKVKDAVLARSTQLSPSARQLLEAAAIVAQRAEL